MRTFTIATVLSASLIMALPPAQTLAAGQTAEPPATRAGVGPWAAAIVRRAAQLIPTPAQWDRMSTGDCPAKATRFSLMCALQKAADDAGTNQPEHSDCRFHATKDGQE